MVATVRISNTVASRTAPPALMSVAAIVIVIVLRPGFGQAAAAPAATQPAGPAPAPATATPPAPPVPPPLTKIPLEELCQFRLENGRLGFGSKMAFTGTAARPVDVVGLAGTTKLSFRPVRFMLNNEQETEAGGVITIYIERRRSYLRLQRTIEPPPGAPGAIETVTFTQGYANDETVRIKSGQARLMVMSGSDTAESIDADDFLALRREQPRAFYRYLAPILRQLHADPLLVVDPWTARQVLAERLPPAQVPAAVTRLVAKLADRSFQVREQATAELASMGQAAMDELRKLDRTGLTAEQSLTIDVLLKRHQPLPQADADALRDNADFLLDCLYSDERGVPPIALARLGKVTRQEIRIDVTVPPEARAPVIETLRGEMAAAAAVAAAATQPTSRPAAP